MINNFILTKDNNYLLDNFPMPLYSYLGLEYQKEYNKNKNYQDISFSITDKEENVLSLLLMTYDKENNTINWYGLPATMVYFNDNILLQKNTLNEFEKRLKNIGNKINLQFCRYNNSNIFNNFDFHLFSRCHLYNKFNVIINLNQTIEEIKSNINKSYKSLLNWGKNNMQLTIYDHSNITEDIMENFRKLHIKIAEKETRSQKTWAIQYKMIKNNEGFIVVGNYDNKNLHYSFYQMNKSNIYYGVSVSDRNYFHKPITHYPMLKAIEYCKAMDKKKFILGDIYENQSTHSDKEKSIANFKRYFTNIIENYICFDGVIKYS